MQIVQQNPNLIILRLRPIMLWISGATFAPFGLFMIFDGIYISADILFIIMGLAALMTRIVTCVFNKSLNTMALKNKVF